MPVSTAISHIRSSHLQPHSGEIIDAATCHALHLPPKLYFLLGWLPSPSTPASPLTPTRSATIYAISLQSIPSAISHPDNDDDAEDDNESKRETPAVVSFSEKQLFFGNASAASATMNPRSIISQVKRLIEHAFGHPAILTDLRRFLHLPLHHLLCLFSVERSSRPTISTRPLPLSLSFSHGG